MTKKLSIICGMLLLLVALVSACGEDETTTTVSGTATTVSGTATTAPGTATTASGTATTSSAGEQNDIVLTVTPAGQVANVFSANFNPFSERFLFPTWSGIYEPLMINNRITGELVPWLAEEYSWSDDLLTLTFTIREGVKWSDNTDLTAEDVAYTFELLRGAGMSGNGKAAIREGGYVDSVTAPDARTVEFHFNQVNTAGFYDIIGQFVVPKHIWENFDDPRKEKNVDPVGTGPFTEIVDMQDQTYEVDRNPYYWQAGQPYVKGLRVVAFSGNEAVAAMLVDGSVDWSGQLIQNIDQAVVANNPDVSYWNAATSVQLFVTNTAIEPFDDPVVRKAISMSLDREKIVQLASQPPNPIADITGLASGVYAAWKVSDPTALGDWMTYDAGKANQMLDDAGYAKGADGVRMTKDGEPWEFELALVNGFSDWLAIGPTLKANLEAIGFDVTIVNWDKSAWMQNLGDGAFEMSLWFGSSGDSPYTYYRAMMSTETLKPIGEASGFGINYWRVGIPEADEALEKFTTTGDISVQKEAAIELQRLFAEYAPAIPTWESGSICNYSTAKVAGWANADDPFVRSMPISGIGTFEQLIQMLSWKPKP